jgi:hypothetical protein
MKISTVVLIGALAGTLGACSGDLFHPTPADVTGSWSEYDGGQFVPGNSFEMSLVDNAGTVTGTGSYAGEAGPFGSLVVSGTSHGDSLHLRIVYVPNGATFPNLARDTAYFDGAFATRDRVNGTLNRFLTPRLYALARLN